MSTTIAVKIEKKRGTVREDTVSVQAKKPRIKKYGRGLRENWAFLAEIEDEAQLKFFLSV